MAAPALNFNRSRTPAAGPSDEELYGTPDMPVMEAAPEAEQPEAPAAAQPVEKDEFDIAAEVVKASSDADADTADASAPASSDEAPSSPETDKPEADPEEDPEKTRDEVLMEEYRKSTGASPEQAQAWLASAKAAAAAAATKQPEESQSDPRQGQDPRQQQPRPVPAGAGAAIGSLIGGIGGGLGSGLRSIKQGVANATNATLRGTGIKASAGLTPEVVRNRLFARWHEDYESGVSGMQATTESLIKTATAYNQLVRTSAPGRELEKIAKSRGTDIKTLISDVTAGTFEDADAKAAVDALRTDPHVQRAWKQFEDNVSAYGENLGKVQHNLTQLAANKSGKIDLEVENARLGEIVARHSKVEKPFELPANPIADNKADGKSPQKSVWEQFMEMSQNGLNFLQSLFDKVASFVAQKFGR